MVRSSGKNCWALCLLILVGVALGGFIGYLTQNISYLSWLNYGQKFGLDNPVIINFGIMVISFGFTIKITMAGVIGTIGAIIIYKRL